MKIGPGNRPESRRLDQVRPLIFFQEYLSHFPAPPVKLRRRRIPLRLPSDWLRAWCGPADAARPVAMLPAFLQQHTRGGDNMNKYLASVVLGSVFLAPAQAAPPTAPADKAKVVGQPTMFLVQPQNVTLAGPRSVQQLVITGKYADGTIRDLTAVL